MIRSQFALSLNEPQNDNQEKGSTMSLEKHDLVHEFPEYREKIHELKMHDAHFKGLFEQYHQVDHDDMPHGMTLHLTNYLFNDCLQLR